MPFMVLTQIMLSDIYVPVNSRWDKARWLSGRLTRASASLLPQRLSKAWIISSLRKSRSSQNGITVGGLWAYRGQSCQHQSLWHKSRRQRLSHCREIKNISTWVKTGWHRKLTDKVKASSLQDVIIDKWSYTILSYSQTLVCLCKDVNSSLVLVRESLDSSGWQSVYAVPAQVQREGSTCPSK